MNMIQSEKMKIKILEMFINFLVLHLEKVLQLYNFRIKIIIKNLMYYFKNSFKGSFGEVRKAIQKETK